MGVWSHCVGLQSQQSTTVEQATWNLGVPAECTKYYCGGSCQEFLEHLQSLQSTTVEESCLEFGSL